MEGIIVRRATPYDNNCLFSAVGYVMSRGIQPTSELRMVLSINAFHDRVGFSEAVTGAFELTILSYHYRREIAVYDTRSSRPVVYGQSRNFSERVLLIFDGLHYDALALSLYEGAPQESDQTIFNILSDRTIGPVERLALNFVRRQQMYHAEATDDVRFLRFN